MTNQEILELMDRFERSSLYTMKLSTGVFSLELSRGAGTSTAAAAPAAPVQTAAQPVAETDEVIASPLAGVFYAAPEPGAEPYVRAGQTVSKGQTLCLIEAMKMMSEVSAPCDCVITQVLGENGALAPYGEPIFRYRPC